jgi:hypothetical protein
MIEMLKSWFGPAKRREPDPVDVAIGVRTGDAAILRGGQVVMTLPAEAVNVMGMAIDDQRAAKRGRAARRPKKPAELPWADTVISDVPTLTERADP